MELLYPIAITAYETTLKRYDAIENRIQSILISILQTTLLLLTLGIGLKTQLVSLWLFLGIFYGLFAVGISLYSKTIGEIIVIIPQNYEKTEKQSKLPIFNFKNQIVQDSHEHFTKNNALIFKKHDLMIGILTSFSLEVFSLILWLLLNSSDQSH